MGLQTALGAWSLDEACLIAGRRIEKALNEGKDPFMADTPAKGYRSAKGSKAIKKVKMKKNGTW